jgi:two-component system, LuxR family, response regulator FixJ
MPMADDRTLHVIDDDDAVRDSLTFFLKASGFAVAAHESADAFLAALPGLEPACVITDIRMPGTSGIDLLGHLTARDPAVPTIVITGHGDVPLAVDAMKRGAVDFIEKPFEDEAILTAVRMAMDRHQAAAANDAARASIRARLAGLSTRERQVLEGLIAGSANKVIAHELSISPRTVEVYRANVMTKMQARSLSELVRMALVAGA